MQSRSRLLRILIIALLCGASASHAEQIVNGGFELPALPGIDFVDLTGSAIVGWTIPHGWSIGLVRDYWPAFEGNQSIDLDGDSGIGATILQTFETVPGQEYSLSFEYANNVDTATAIGRVQVIGSTALVDTTVTHSGSTTDDMDYVAFAANFTADSPSSTLQLTHLGPVWGRGLAVDAVSVTLAGPTPCTSTTWGRMKSIFQ